MTLQEALITLKIHQQWRKGDDIPMRIPPVVTKAIDVILNHHSQTEISDIENEAERYEKVDGVNAFIQGAKWHKEKYIKDNKISLLEEDLECIHSYLDYIKIPRKDDKDNLYSIIGRIIQLQLNNEKQISELDTYYLSRLFN